LSSVVLPAPLGPIRPMRSPRRMRSSRNPRTTAFAEALQTCFQLGHQLAAGAAGIHLQLDLAHAFAPRRMRSRAAPVSRARGPPLRVRRASTPLRIQTSSCLEQLVGAGVGQRLVRAAVRTPCALEGGEVAGVAAQLAAVELDDARAHAFEEGAVVRDDEQRRAGKAAQHVLQPQDAAMSRWLVGSSSSSTSGCDRQRLGQRQALLLAQPAPSRPGRQRRQHGGLAGPVAADQRDALARVEQKIRMIEQRNVTIRDTGVGEFEIRHGSQ
jgi:hypothetical protein